MRRRAKVVIFFYLSILVVFVGTVCLMGLQDSQQEDRTAISRCQSLRTELCPLQDTKFNFPAVFQKEQILREVVMFKKSKARRQSHSKSEFSGQSSDTNRVEKFPYSQNFPPLYQPALSNGLNCTKVWMGDSAELTRAASLLNMSLKPSRRPEGFYDFITRDCVQYRKEMGYIEEVSEEEKAFPLAFSVLLYKDVEQVERLLRAVYRPHNLYCVHTDLKASAQLKRQVRKGFKATIFAYSGSKESMLTLVRDLVEPAWQDKSAEQCKNADSSFADEPALEARGSCNLTIKALAQCLPNVFEAPRQVNVTWGTFTVLEPELVCMEALLRTHRTWRYVINLTGQEFPLKTNKELVAILRSYRGANDIYGSDLGKQWSFRWTSAGPPPHNITPAKGPVHVAASRGFVDFVLHSPVAQDFLQWAKNTSVPDETFFATMNNQHQLGIPGSFTGNTSSSRRIMVNRLKVWRTSKWPCHGQIVRSICHFGPLDLSFIVKHRHMFVNKFTYDYLPLGYDCLEQWYFNKIKRESMLGKVDIDTRYYENLEIVKYALRINSTTERR